MQGLDDKSVLMRWLHRSVLLILIWLLSACGAHVFHIVEPGETMYSISWVYGYDYRDVARWNDISSPYTIRSGQRLRVAPPENDVRPAPAPAVTARTPGVQPAVNGAQAQKPAAKSAATNASIEWQWPAQGKVINFFSSSSLNKGIDIAGKEGQAVYAAASGKVVYAGSGLVGYGNLIIINHSPEFLSAYAHNRELKVSEGSVVKKGAVIALMGNSGADRVKLHFQIRREGVPVNPLPYMPKTHN